MEPEVEPGLETPFLSPDDLLFLGGPSALRAVGAMVRNAGRLGGRTGAIPMAQFERNAARFAPAPGERTLYHATDMPWEGTAPRPNTWFSSEPPFAGNPFGQTVRAYTVPEELLNTPPLPRGLGFGERIAASDEGPIAAVNEGHGLISYVVRDPSVLARKDVSMPRGVLSRFLLGQE